MGSSKELLQRVQINPVAAVFFTVGLLVLIVFLRMVWPFLVTVVTIIVIAFAVFCIVIDIIITVMIVAIIDSTER